VSDTPSTPGQMDARALASSRREALRRRTRRIRRSVAGLAVTMFALVFAIVYVQLASGHDPALSANAARRRAALVASKSESTGTPSSSESSTSTSESGSSSSTGTEEESSSGASAVRTSQS
jgi:hypothetical protein